MCCKKIKIFSFAYALLVRILFNFKIFKIKIGSHLKDNSFKQYMCISSECKVGITVNVLHVQWKLTKCCQENYCNNDFTLY